MDNCELKIGVRQQQQSNCTRIEDCGPKFKGLRKCTNQQQPFNCADLDDREPIFKGLQRCKKNLVHYQDEQQQFDLTDVPLEPNFKRLRRCNKSGVNHQDLQQQSSNWPDLPVGLLCEIMDRLIFADDYVRFGAVCISWRNAQMEDRKKHKFSDSSSFPLLLIPPHGYEDEQEEEDSNSNHQQQTQTPLQQQWIKAGKKPQVRSLYNVITKKVCSNFQVALSHNKYCRGSSFGWLVTMRRTSNRIPNRTPKYDDCKYKWCVQLLNPFLSDKHNNIIDLPTLCSIVKQDGDHDNFRPFFYLVKAVLSSDPLITPKNYVVMGIMGHFRKLAFYTPQNKDWTPVNWKSEEWSYLADVIYFNKTQQFFAVLQTGEVLAIDLIKKTRKGRFFPKLTQLAPSPNEATPRFRYLVETSTGELLQVAKINCGKQIKFQVLKFDPVGQVWIEIHDIGGNMLFIGDNASICRSAADFLGLKSNCIYYTNYVSQNRSSCNPYGSQDAGIYNIEDGSFKPHYPMESKLNFPTPIWIDPTLQRCNHF